MPNTDVRLIKTDTHFRTNAAAWTNSSYEQITLGFYPRWVIADNMTDAPAYLFDSTAADPLGKGITPYDVIPARSFKIIPIQWDRQNWTLVFEKSGSSPVSIIRLVFTDDPHQATATHMSDRPLAAGLVPGAFTASGSLANQWDLFVWEPDTSNRSLQIDKLVFVTNSSLMTVGFKSYVAYDDYILSLFPSPNLTGSTTYAPSISTIYSTMNGRSYPWEVTQYDTTNNRYAMETYGGPIMLPMGFRIDVTNAEVGAKTYELRATYRYV